MSSFPLIVINQLSILLIILGLTNSINCKVSQSKLLTKPNQSTLIKLGFSGIFWNYIQSNRTELNNLTPKCLSKLKHISDLIESDNPEALKLLSLSSHLPNKMFEISYADLEGYDQCLSLQSTHYCQASVIPMDNNLYPHWFSLRYNTTIHIGFCLPSICTPDQVDYLITSAIKSYDWQKVYFHGCQVPSTFLERLSKSNSSQFGSFLFLSGIVLIVVVTTILDHFNFFDKVNRFKWLKHFTIQSTNRNLINNQINNRISLIDYFRILISIIFQMVHSFALICISNLLYTTESLSTLREFISQWTYQPFNSDWLYGGLIYLGATAAGTHVWSIVEVDTPITTYVWIFIKKLIIFWPALIVTINLKIILPLLGTGPVYTYHTQWRSDVCASNWLYTLLHIHNYQNAYDMCIGPFWSMDAELHLFAVALIFVYLYKKSPRTAYVLNTIVMIIGLAVVFNTYYSNNFVYRLAGYKFEHWEQIESYITKTYLRSESHLFAYSLALMVTYHCWMNPSSSIGLSKIISRLITVLLIILIVLAAYSPGLWNVLKIETTPFWYALHATICKAVVSVGFAWIGWLGFHDERVYKLMIKSKVKLDINHNKLIDEKPVRNEKLHQSNAVLYKLSLAASRATYFSHWPLYIWFYANKTKVYLDSRFLTDLSFLIAIGYFSGLIFHFLVIGPVESIISSFKRRKTNKIE
ncbi:uncharacterized protein LOC128395513 [Panonychus citri]|uniref:uncharacterized protein LOC128395513 n=1 Tax=Panonychus citri TaxID=50023 RepID=UPI0023079761|nr:uncharacterized protein LOC128395513 [Panonychus citri]